MVRMPKRVDPTERRTQIADALMRVAAERGLEAVSLRHVAAEAGATTALVQHYFRTKDEMMLFALEVVGGHIEERIDAAVERARPGAGPARPGPRDGPPLLPLDDERRADGEGRVGLLRVRGHPARRSPRCSGEARVGLRDYLATLMPEPAATTLLALVEGLALYMITDTYPADRGSRVLDDFLDAVFSPAGGRP